MEIAPRRTKLLKLLGYKKEMTSVSFDFRDCCDTEDWLEDPDWDAVDRWLMDHPEEARLALLVRVDDPPAEEEGEVRHSDDDGSDSDDRDDNGERKLSPLSVALWHRRQPAPAHVVEALLEACPPALEYERDENAMRFVHSISGDRHRTDEWVMRLHPLVVAVRNSALCIDAFAVLLQDSCQEAIVDMRILHRALLDENLRRRVQLIKDIISSAPEAIAKEIRDQYPIHIALDRVAPLEVVRSILTELMEYDADHNCGLQHESYISGKSALETAVSAWYASSGDDDVDLVARRLQHILECFRFVGAQKADLDDFGDYPPILGAVVYAALGSSHPRGPLSAVKSLVERDRTSCYEAQDSLGRTALHVAVKETAQLCQAVDTARLMTEDDTMLAGHLEEWRNFLHEYLIDGDGGAAARVIDEDGNLPLHLAASCTDEEGYCLTIEGGLDVLLEAFPTAAEVQNEVGEFPLERAIKGGLGREEGLELLLKTCPKALHSRGAELDLFMLAASAEFLAEKTHPDVDTIYMLLRENPSAVTRGISPSSHELYLEKKLLQSRKENAELTERVAEYEKRQKELMKQLSELKKENNELTEKSQKKRRKRDN